MPKPVRGLLFDLGGTLFSYVLGPEMGRPIFEAAEALEIEARKRDIGRVWGEVNAETMRSFAERQTRAVVDSLPIRDDTLETLAGLKERGLYVAIVSNIDDEQLEPLVSKHGLDNVLDDWTSSEEARSCKPHARIYHYSLEKAGLGVDDALFVGDSLHHDVAGASAVGMRSVRIGEPDTHAPLSQGLEITAQPDYEIRNLSELLRIVDELNAG